MGSNSAGREHKPLSGVAICGPNSQAKAALAQEVRTGSNVTAEGRGSDIEKVTNIVVADVPCPSPDGTVRPRKRKAARLMGGYNHETCETRISEESLPKDESCGSCRCDRSEPSQQSAAKKVTLAPNKAEDNIIQRVPA